MNGTTMARNSTESEEKNIKLVNLPYSWTILIMIIMTLVLVLTIIGNITVMIVLRYSRALNSFVNSHFLVSLSTADLLVAILVMPGALDAVHSGWWRCGRIWGICNGFGNFLFCISSIMHLMMLSIDRYLAIVRPLFYPLEMTKSRAICLCFVLWIYSAIWAFLPLFGVSSYECFITYIGTCKAEDWSKYGLNFAFAISVVSGTYGLALMMMAFVYWKIARVIRSQHQRIGDVTLSSQKQRVNNREARKLKRNKGLATLMIVTLVYLICWSPFCVLLFIEIGTGQKVEGPYSTVSMLVGFTNSCCNPIIYSIKYRRFRRAVLSMIGKTTSVMKFSISNGGLTSMAQEYTARRVETIGRTGLRLRNKMN